MSKVWLVTDGCYSDYHVLGVFSSPELANVAKARLFADNEVTEFELDDMPAAPYDEFAWDIWFDASGNVKEWNTIGDARITSSSMRRGVNAYWSDGQMRVFARGRDFESALKSATDTRRIWLAIPVKPTQRIGNSLFVEVK